MSFVGSYNPVPLTANDKSVLYLGAENMLYYPSANKTIGSCRAYFQLNNITAGDPSNPVKAFVLNFGDEDPTNLKDLKDSKDLNDDVWYDLSGRKLDGKPSKGGIYIHNGRKTVVK